ncbi:MAG TPA: TIM-barrel domain-containing protein, partial [Ardenticatenaceae bacterium]
MPSLVPKETPGSMQGREHDVRGLTMFFEQGCLRVSLLANNLARVRFAPGGEFAPRRSWDVAAPDNSFEPVPFDLSEEEGGFVLTTEALRITISSRGEVAFRDRDGETFAADLAPVTWEEANLEEANLRRREGDTLPEGAARVELRLRKRAPEGEHYYGFGERTGLLDKRGRVMTNWTIDPEFGHGRSHDNLYQAHPFFMALRPGLAWGCFLHSTWYSQFDAGATKWEEVEFVTHGGELDYYVVYGPTPAGVVEGLTRLTGRPFLPPLWALGYHQSRWGYMNEEEMREMAREFRERDLPLDVLHFDIDYMRGYRDFTWHPERFPDPKALLDDLREQEVRVVTIIDPGVKYDLSEEYGVARDGLMQDAFIYNADGTPYSGYCWPDAAL